MNPMKIIRETDLKLTIRVPVCFSEVDSMRAVWHGNYVQYMEEAREEWGRKMGMSYVDIFKNGYLAPVYELNLHYRQIATVDDILLVTITYCQTRGAKLIFHYEVRRERDDALILTAESLQLFTTQTGEFSPTMPPFYAEWIAKYIE